MSKKGNPLGNPENFSRAGSFADNKEWASECGKKGAKRTQEVKRQKKAMREQLQTLLSLPVKDKTRKKDIKSLGLETEDIDNQAALLVSVFKKALRGDVEAARFIRDTIGEGPTSKIDVSAETLKTADDILIKVRSVAETTVKPKEGDSE